jgi:hypothetical protein
MLRLLQKFLLKGKLHMSSDSSTLGVGDKVIVKEVYHGDPVVYTVKRIQPRADKDGGTLYFIDSETGERLTRLASQLTKVD